MTKMVAICARVLIIMALLLVGRSTSGLSAPNFDCTAVTEIPQSECQALAALYLSAGGDGWTRNVNWSTDNLPSNWQGVTVSGGHVTRLEQTNNNMVGSLPAELGNLTFLTELNMGDNQLTGPIPNSIGGMTSLVGLNLWSNALTGSIPATVANLTNLEALGVGGNNLSGPLPTSITGLTHLKYLTLGDNHFTGSIPSAYGDLVTLEILEMRNNDLTGTIPTTLGNLTNLTGLHLAANALTGEIPASLGNLTKLKELELQVNQLYGNLPASLWGLTDLEIISLRGNNFTGSIPVQFGNLTKLTAVDFRFNMFSGSIPTTVGNLTQLIYLQFTHNQLTGPIPHEIGNLTNLEALSLNENKLSGDVPQELAQLTHLYDPDVDPFGRFGLELGFNWLNVPQPYPANPPTPLQNFLLAKDPNWQDTQTVADGIPTSGGEITSSDGASTVTIPPNAVTTTTTLAFVPQTNPAQPLGDLIFINKSFQIQALDDEGDPLDSFTFAKPITITTQYEDVDVQGVDEKHLILYYWDIPSSSWRDASTTCSPHTVYQRDLVNNTLSVEICHLTEFALLVDPPQVLFIPLLRR